MWYLKQGTNWVLQEKLISTLIGDVSMRLINANGWPHAMGKSPGCNTEEAH